MLNLTDGHNVPGVVLDEHRFLGRMKGGQLLQVAVDPRKAEDLKQVAANPELESIRRIRADVQRLFEGAKAKNVEPYAKYIVALKAGTAGMTPPIILFTEQQLPTEAQDNGMALGQIPYGTQVVAIDGETQLAARFEAANLDPSTKNEFVPVVICHGKPVEWARQVFHDLNTLAVQPNAALSISMDQRDPITHLARQLEKRVSFFNNRVNMVRRQLRRSDPHVVTITALRGACVTFAEGIGGVRYGARPVLIDPARVPLLEEGSIEWFSAIADTFGPALEDRDRTLAAAPAVLAAIGAIGHSLTSINDPLERAARRAELVDRLRPVQWAKDKAWEGIAGKFSPKGTFSVGGSKETAYAVYAALTDQGNAGFKRVRGEAEAIAA